MCVWWTSSGGAEMALRTLGSREEILADLSSAGEPMTPQVIERYRLAAGVAGE